MLCPWPCLNVHQQHTRVIHITMIAINEFSRVPGAKPLLNLSQGDFCCGVEVFACMLQVKCANLGPCRAVRPRTGLQT